MPGVWKGKQKNTILVAFGLMTVVEVIEVISVGALWFQKP